MDTTRDNTGTATSYGKFTVTILLETKTGRSLVQEENVGVPPTHALFLLEEHTKQFRERLRERNKNGTLTFFS